MVPSDPQLGPQGTAEAPIGIDAPPLTGAFLSWPRSQKPTHCPSGEKKTLCGPMKLGPPDWSWSPIATGSSRSSVRRYSFPFAVYAQWAPSRSEEHTSELQSLRHLVCRLLLEK